MTKMIDGGFGLAANHIQNQTQFSDVRHWLTAGVNKHIPLQKKMAQVCTWEHRQISLDNSSSKYKACLLI